MSLPMIDDMVEAVGYSERFINYYYKIPNMDFCNGLKPIQSGSEVQTISEGDVRPTPLKPRRYMGLLAIERPEVDDCCTSQLVQTCVIEVGERNADSGND
ncbi:hypothetical protein DVH24_025582 [Malus domestica]|uniref:Uncharacterized protein n=1 Tax=Malus domestica TaxID=3750 RepID=A0A498HSF2_MALDO|nr:hypothetical protein DVH24_025582 [Malus domestica]